MRVSVPFALFPWRGHFLFPLSVFFSPCQLSCLWQKKVKTFPFLPWFLGVARSEPRVINRRRDMLPNAIRCLHRQQLVECFRV